MKKHIGIIGGGAAGMMAAVTAARKGTKVTILERNDRIGKKILQTGNGKCNLGNKNLTVECYHGEINAENRGTEFEVTVIMYGSIQEK